MHRPERRSRNAGRTQGGRVQDGRPREKWSRSIPESIWERLSKRNGSRLHVTENPSRDFVHPATIDECEAVLARLPRELTDPVRAIVLRRPRKRDEDLGVEAWRRCGCVALVAFPRCLEFRWAHRVTDGVRRHYAPWCDRWRITDRESILTWTLDEARRYHLFHLLLHEVGHVNEPHHYRGDRAEAFAENFALDWARRLGELEPS